MPTDKKLKKGDRVETKHGESLVVLDTAETPAKKKGDTVVKPAVTLVLAESGGHKCWFATGSIK